ncbi:MAG: GAF domain-containing sensor histidine kinase [Kofleriaceae bacterium]
MPVDEATRQACLDAHAIVDTPPEGAFDDVAAIAAAVCEVPIALVSLVDRQRQWFKARHGLDEPELARAVSFCGHAILGRDALVVPDATLDPRFHDNPLTTGAPFVRFYAGAPLITSDGHALGTLCVIDHVARTLTEMQLATLTRLARQVVTLLELRTARARAEAASRAKSAFVASVSQRLRTQLTGILGLFQLGASMAITDEQRELEAIATSTGHQLVEVVDELLTFSLLLGGRGAPAALPVDLAALVHDVVAMLRSAADAKGLALTAEVAPGLEAPRRSDAPRFRQVLLNVVGNAIKFTETGAVVVRVAGGPASDQVEVQVIDTGVGIAPGDPGRVFERFAQIDPARANPHHGPGLGLPVARMLAWLLGGDIAFVSEPGRGSTFVISLRAPLA